MAKKNCEIEDFKYFEVSYFCGWVIKNIRETLQKFLHAKNSPNRVSSRA